MVLKSFSIEDTYQIAANIAEKFKDKGGVIALSGELGAGKTTFTQGFAKALGVEDKIISPTFVLIRQHSIPNQKRILFHIDLYRLEDDISLKESGIADTFLDPGNIVLIEWAEKAKNQLPKDTLWIHISKNGEERIIEIKD